LMDPVVSMRGRLLYPWAVVYAQDYSIFESNSPSTQTIRNYMI
jgi:hypothetical protein